MKLLERVAEIEAREKNAAQGTFLTFFETLTDCREDIPFLCNALRVLADAVEAQQRVLDYAKIGEEIDVNELVRLVRRCIKAHEKAARLIRGEEATEPYVGPATAFKELRQVVGPDAWRGQYAEVGFDMLRDDDEEASPDGE